MSEVADTYPEVWLHAISDTSSGSSIVQGPFVLKVTKMIAVTSTNIIYQNFCFRTLSNNIRTYGSASEYFTNFDGTTGTFGNCLQDNDDGVIPPISQSYHAFISIDTSGVISINTPSENYDPSLPNSFTYYFSC